MSAVVQVLDRAHSVVDERSAPPVAAKSNRWGAPLWPADEPLARPRRVVQAEIPLEIYVIVAVYGRHA